jgi:hypothetical protein
MAEPSPIGSKTGVSPFPQQSRRRKETPLEIALPGNPAAWRSVWLIQVSLWRCVGNYAPTTIHFHRLTLELE